MSTFLQNNEEHKMNTSNEISKEFSIEKSYIMNTNKGEEEDAKAFLGNISLNKKLDSKNIFEADNSVIDQSHFTHPNNHQPKNIKIYTNNSINNSFDKKFLDDIFVENIDPSTNTNTITNADVNVINKPQYISIQKKQINLNDDCKGLPSTGIDKYSVTNGKIISKKIYKRKALSLTKNEDLSPTKGYNTFVIDYFKRESNNKGMNNSSNIINNSQENDLNFKVNNNEIITYLIIAY